MEREGATYVKPSAVKVVALAAVTSAITGLGFLLTAPIPLIPGAIHWRVLAFLPCIFGIFFGPGVGFISGAIGNTLWALLGGYFNLATPIFDLTGVGLTGLIPGLFVKPHECNSLAGLAKAALVSFVAGMIMVPIVAVGFDLVGVAPFIPACVFLILSDIPPIVIGTPVVAKGLAPTLLRRGLLRERL
ncbi:TPA: histidine kinase [Candidatus Bathyarchaeota archaeon]|nr:histidine kinase [Candidatus Bathyarchaeota archaeon]